jgi:hypothetical protein
MALECSRLFFASVEKITQEVRCGCPHKNQKLQERKERGFNIAMLFSSGPDISTAHLIIRFFSRFLLIEQKEKSSYFTPIYLALRVCAGFESVALELVFSAILCIG